MDYVLFNCFLGRLNADSFPPSFKCDQTDGEFHLEHPLFIRGDAIDLSFQLVSDTLRISEAPGQSFCLSIR
jgi:hypothetical protein